MGYSSKWVAKHPEDAAKLLDYLEAQLANKFFCIPEGFQGKSMSPEDWDKATTPEEINKALAFADALDYSFAYLRWVHVIKFLAVAYRRMVPSTVAHRKGDVRR